MSITRKLKWKRCIEQLKFQQLEIRSIGEIVKSVGPEFQQYYESFCATRHIDLSALNEKYQERIKELYTSGQPDEQGTDNDEPNIDCPEDSAIVIQNNPSYNDTPANDTMSPTEEDREMDEAFSRFFKNIALVLHPDRIDKSLPEHIQKDMISRFQDANKALEQKKYFILLDVADQFGIKPPRNQTQQMRWMKRESAKMKAYLDKQKSTYNYKFAEADTPEDRDKLIEQFLYQLFRLKLSEKS
jgi:hypothetical protein